MHVYVAINMAMHVHNLYSYLRTNSYLVRECFHEDFHTGNCSFDMPFCSLVPRLVFFQGEKQKIKGYFFPI